MTEAVEVKRLTEMNVSVIITCTNVFWCFLKSQLHFIIVLFYWMCQVMKENDIKNIIFSSSATVYGTPQYLPVDENHPVGGCTNAYGKTKFFIEEIIRDLCNADKVRSKSTSLCNESSLLKTLVISWFLLCSVSLHMLNHLDKEMGCKSSSLVLYSFPSLLLFFFFLNLGPGLGY